MSDSIHEVNYKGHTIKVYQDTDAESPREWDNLGVMYCEHRRYTLGDKDAENPFIQNEGTGKWELRDDVVVAMPLYLIDHSGLAMRCHSFRDVDPQEWDSGQVGVIYVTREKLLKEFPGKKITPELIEKARKILISEVKTYDDYLRGNVYGYVVESPDGRDVGSCWGFYPGSPVPWSFEGSIEDIISEAKSDVDSDIYLYHQ